MCDFLPDIRDVHNIQTKITFCEDTAPDALNNTLTTSNDVAAEVSCANIKTEIKTEHISDTEDSIPNDNNTITTDTRNVGNNFESTQQKNEILENANFKKRNNCETSAENVFPNSINEENDQNKWMPRKKVCARRSSILKETPTSTHTGNEPSHSFQDNNLPTNHKSVTDNGSKQLLQVNEAVINNNPVKLDKSSQNAATSRENEALSHRTFANGIVALCHQLEVLAQSNVIKDIQYRNRLEETLYECFRSLHSIILQYIFPKKHDKTYIWNLVSFIEATAKHKQVNVSNEFIILILKRMIFWTLQEINKAKLQYLENVLLDNIDSDHSEKPNETSSAVQNQEVKSYFFSSSSEAGKDISSCQITEPSRGTITDSPIIINNVGNNLNTKLNHIDEAVIKYNVLQRSNIPVNTVKEQTPILKQFLSNNDPLPSVITTNPTYVHNMNPQLNQQSYQKVHNQATITSNYNHPPKHQPPIYSQQYQTKQPSAYQNQIVNTTNITQQHQLRTGYPNQMSNTTYIQQQNQLPPMCQNQAWNPSSISQQVWQQHPNYDQAKILGYNLKYQFQQNNQQPPLYQNQLSNSNQQRNQQRPLDQNQMRRMPSKNNVDLNNIQAYGSSAQNSYLFTNYQEQIKNAPTSQNRSPAAIQTHSIQKQNQQLPPYQTQISSASNPSKRNINLNNIQAYGSSAQNPYQFTNHQAQTRNEPLSQYKSSEARSVYDTTEYFDISLFDALESSNTNCDAIQPSSPLSSLAPVVITTPVSTNPERSMSRDSGFISPPAENMETFSPTITHVTSLNKDVILTKNSSCFICKRVTNYKCVGCHETYYCSTKCQYMDWTSHQLKCAKEKK